MKKIFLTQLLVVLALAVFGQSGFEGIIVLETQTAKTSEQATTTISVNGSDTRLDVISQTPDYSSEYSLVVDSKGAAMISNDDVTELDASIFKKPSNPNMKLTSKTERVSKNCYETTAYVFSDGKSEARYWVADVFGINYGELPAMFQNIPMPEGGFNGIPVAVEMTDEDGAVKSSQKLVSVTKKEVPASTFDRK